MPSQLSFLLTLPTKMELTECSETSAHKIQTPENHSKKKSTALRLLVKGLFAISFVSMAKEELSITVIVKLSVDTIIVKLSVDTIIVKLSVDTIIVKLSVNNIIVKVCVIPQPVTSREFKVQTVLII